jgi:hypothetical protein
MVVLRGPNYTGLDVASLNQEVLVSTRPCEYRGAKRPTGCHRCSNPRFFVGAPPGARPRAFSRRPTLPSGG